MDNSPETKKTPTTPAGTNAGKPAAPVAATQPAAPSSAPAPAKPAEPSPEPAKPTEPAKSAKNEGYKTANIGKWKSQQEDYFAKQNQAHSEKKAKQKAARKKALPFIIAGVAIVVIALGTWGVVSLINYLNRPTLEETASDPSVISGNSSAAIKNYQDYLQQVYNEALNAAMAEEGTDEPTDEAKQKANEALSDAVANTANTEAGEKYRDAMRFSEMMVYYDTWQCDGIMRLENQINPGNLNLESQYRYNLAIQNCYQVRGDTKRADELWKTVIELYGQVYEGDTGRLREGVSD